MFANTKLNLLIPFSAGHTDVGSIYFRKTIYLTTPFLGIFLERNLMPVEALSFLRGAIVDARYTVDCLPIINWLWVALTRKSGIDQMSTLAMLQPNSTLRDVKLKHHYHQAITRHLSGIDSVLQRVQGLLIATQIGEVAVEMVPGGEGSYNRARGEQKST